MDLAITLYFYLLLLALMGASIFFTDWIRMRGATIVFKYVAFLFLAIAIDAVLMSIARYKYIIGDQVFVHKFLTSILWEIRLLPLVIVLTVFVGHMYWRFFIERKNL